MKGTGSKLSMLLLVLTTGCSWIPSNPEGLGLWADIATLPIPTESLGPLFDLIGITSFVIAAGWFFLSNKEGRRWKIVVFLAAFPSLAYLSLILTNFGRKFWPPDLSFVWIWLKLGLPFEGPLSDWAAGYTILAALIHLAIQVIIIIWFAKNLIIAARHFEPSRLLDPIGLMIGWLFFPYFYYFVVVLLGSIGPALFGPIVGEVVKWMAPTSGLYIFLVVSVQYMSYIWFPREFSRRTSKPEEEKGQDEKDRKGFSPELWATIAAVLVAMGYNEERIERARALPDGGSVIYGNPPDYKKLPGGPTISGSGQDRDGSSPPPNSGNDSRRTWHKTERNDVTGPKGEKLVAWTNESQETRYFPEGVDPNISLSENSERVFASEVDGPPVTNEDGSAKVPDSSISPMALEPEGGLNKENQNTDGVLYESQDQDEYDPPVTVENFPEESPSGEGSSLDHVNDTSSVSSSESHYAEESRSHEDHINGPPPTPDYEQDSSSPRSYDAVSTGTYHAQEDRIGEEIPGEVQSNRPSWREDKPPENGDDYLPPPTPDKE